MTLKRSPMKRRQIKKVWDDAQVKRGPCRVCGRGDTELAHSVGQKYQDEKRAGPSGGKYLWVSPHSVIPLCKSTLHLPLPGTGAYVSPGCHERYDARQLSILGLLTFPELMNASRACKKYGIDCRRRLTGGIT